MPLKPLPVRRYLRRHPRLGRWLSQADEQARLVEKVRSALSSELAVQVVGAGRQGRRLTLRVASPAWATRLRYEAAGLVGQISGIDQVRIKVTPPGGVAPAPRRLPRPVPPSPGAIAALRTLANILDNPRLAKRLRSGVKSVETRG